MNLKSLEGKIPIFNFVFGIIVVLGGVIGYWKAHSIPSLAAGLFFGNLLMLSIWGVSDAKSNKIWGFYLANIVSISLLIFFIYRLIKTSNLLPAIIIIPLAIIAVLANTWLLHQNSLQKSSGKF
jgi:uncharacterized membrane protein (UPF0136 family)